MTNEELGSVSDFIQFAKDFIYSKYSTTDVFPVEFKEVLTKAEQAYENERKRKIKTSVNSKAKRMFLARLSE